MALPFFYWATYIPGEELITLTEEESKHIITVLRMKPGERLHLTDGKGHLLTAEIVADHKKKCVVKIVTVIQQPAPAKNITIAISLLKNNNRLEWFLEKATEIGVTEIIPLLCSRTEKQHFRYERLHHILVSAMLQSQQCWLPALQAPVKFDQLMAASMPDKQKWIAHCAEGPKNSLPDNPLSHSGDQIIVIGPEGDFTAEEIEKALAKQFIPVTLGANRLRTETAGVVAATLLCIN